MNINNKIEEANIQDICNGQTGDCLTVAIALKEVFGGDIMFLTETPGEGFNHAFIKKDGFYYDSYGKRYFSDMFDMHIPKELESENPEDHIYKPSNPKIKFESAYNQNLKNKIVKKLK